MGVRAEGKKEGSTFLAFAKSSGVFFVGSTLSKVITLLLIPLYTRVLPTEDYGYYDLSITCVTLLTSLLYCDIWSSVMRGMREDLEGEQPWHVVTAGWFIFGCSTALYYVIALCAATFVEIPNLVLVLAYGTFHNVHSMVAGVARGWGKNAEFAISGVLCTLVNVGLNLLLILAWGFGYEALYISYIAGFVVQSLYLCLRVGMFRSMRVPSAAQVRELFLFTAPLGINSVAYWLLNSLSRVVVATVLSFAANGVFAIGSKFGTAVALVTACFTLAWQDVAFTKERRPAGFYANAAGQYAGFLLASLAVLTPVVSLAFPLLVGSDYSEAYGLVPSFLWIAVLSAVSTFIGNTFYAIKETKAVGVSTVASCLVNVALVYPLTVRFGCAGANASVLVSFALNIAIRLVILRRSIGMRIEWRRLLLPAVMATCATAVYMNAAMIPNVATFFVALAGTLILYREKIELLVEPLWRRICEKGR